jgi:hypothetical protein
LTGLPVKTVQAEALAAWFGRGPARLR